MKRPGTTRRGRTGDEPPGGVSPLGPRLLPGIGTLLMLVLALCVVLLAACEPAIGEGSSDETTSTSENGGEESGDVAGSVDEEIKAGRAVITVRALEATFQPAMPEQRLSEQTPAAPGAGESFYQAYVRVENTGEIPIRVDAEDFMCAVGESVVAIEPTRSGPPARSLLKNASLDLVLTFKAQAGFEPVLVYRPPWYDGTITVSPESEEDTTTTT